MKKHCLRSIFLLFFSAAFIGCDKSEEKAPDRHITFSKETASGSEGTTSVDIVLTTDLIDAVNSTKVDYTVTGGTATGNGVDFILTSGTAVFPPNTTATTITLVIINDILQEESETIEIELSNPVNGVLGSFKKFIYTIVNRPVPVPTLVLYVPLNGNPNDSSGFTNTSLFSNISFASDRHEKTAAAGVFDESYTYVRFANTTVLDTLTHVTLAAWVKPVSFYGTGSNPIIHKASLDPNVETEENPSTYVQYHLGITGDQYWHFQSAAIFSARINGEYVYVSTPDYTCTPGEWIHIVGTYDGETLKIYINGELSSSVSAPGNLSHAGRDVFIGKQELENDVPHNLPGTFDEIRIYSGAMTAEQVVDLFNN